MINLLIITLYLRIISSPQAIAVEVLFSVELVCCDVCYHCNDCICHHETFRVDGQW